MPSNLYRSPEELHRVYVSNTEAFYSVAGREHAAKLDDFVESCVLRLWKNSPSISQKHVDSINVLYSRGRKRKSKLLWELTSEIANSKEILPPLFFWTLAENDAATGKDNSRIFIRALTNILLYLAAVDDEVSEYEARFITDCADRLNAVCDSCGVRKSKPGLDPAEFVTSPSPPLMQKGTQGEGSGKKDEAHKAAEEKKTEEKPSLDEMLEELDNLIGLHDIKKDVKSLINLIKVRNLRKSQELKVPPLSLHMVFMGNPGTGKTTVARLMGGIYAAMGVLREGQLIEVDRSGLVAGFVGQTALKTQEVIKSALGGILFIDEAYSLALGGENDFGREAIETLLKAMEDHRDDLIVIVAGYDKPMEIFLESNPGLKSRFNKFLHFPDYTGEELFGIFKLQCRKNMYTLSPEAEEALKRELCIMYENREENFGNGREVRNIFEDSVINHSNRVAAIEKPTREELMTLTSEDIVLKKNQGEESYKDEKLKGEENFEQN